MRTYTLFVLCFLAIATDLSAVSITSQLSAAAQMPGADATYQYTYNITNLTLQANEELDIYFDPSVYQEVSDAIVGSDFQYVLFAPSSSPSEPGDFGIAPNSNNTVVNGPFGVSFTLTGQGVPGPQYFTVSEFSPSGGLIGIVASGMTSMQSPVAAPEPAGAGLTGIALLMGTMWCAGRLRGSRQAQ
jgi:hypothetical protein